MKIFLGLVGIDKEDISQHDNKFVDRWDYYDEVQLAHTTHNPIVEVEGQGNAWCY